MAVFLDWSVAGSGVLVVVGAVARPMACLATLVAIAFGVSLVLKHQVHHLGSSDWQVVRARSRRSRVVGHCGKMSVGGGRWCTSVSGVASGWPFLSIE